MPNKKKKFKFLIPIIGIIGSLSVYLNSYFHNNPHSLEKQEEIINNHQEEIINHQEIILYQTIVNLIVFLLIFLIVFLFVYFFPSSPVVKNNQKETIEGNKTNTDFGRSILRKTGDFDGERLFEKEYALYFYDLSKYNIEGNEKYNVNENNEDEEVLKQLFVANLNVNNYGFDLGFSPDSKNVFNFSQYKGAFTVVKDQKRIPNLTLKQIIEIKKNSGFETKKGIFLNRFKDDTRRTITIKGRQLDSFNQEMQAFYSGDNFVPTCQKFFECLQGKTNFFNFHNIIAFLFSYGIFLSSFYILFLVINFIYSLAYAFLFLDEEEIKEEEEKNKFLIAFYRTLRAITFFNLHGFSKIIPILCLSGVLIFDGYLFFGKNIFFFPIFYNDKEKKFLIICNNDDLKDFLKGGKVVIPINNYHKSSFFLPPEENLLPKTFKRKNINFY